ncbi:MAG: nucleotidyltransferase domain-containing protein [Acidobacteriota bacterium]|nr:nucleotidyltransferase domain-containing protein [Acidobacteriota bacterium]
MKKTIERIVGYAARVAEPDKIFLFGSLANDTGNVHSDLDLLLVADVDLLLKKQISEQIKQYAQELMLGADVLIYSEAELENAAQKEPSSFVAGVLKSGKIIYQKN